ncbi:5881_t:CDS:2, partial [Cetraspora pellucida]
MSSNNIDDEESVLAFGFEITNSNKQQKAFASCERVFSTLKWIYGKKKTYLVFEKVESLAKIHQYYTTYVKEEIFYIDYELTLEDILIVANKTGKLDSNDSNKDFDKDYVENSKVEFELYNKILKLKEAFNFDHKIFKENDKNNNVNSSFENVVKENPNYNYN